MKQVAQDYRNGALNVSDVPAPVLRPGGLLVANRFSLISSGTEKSTAAMARKSLLGKARERPELVRKVLDQIRKEGLADTARRVFDRLNLPGTPGYSCAGTVIEVGEGVGGFSVGDPVACAGQQYASHSEVVFVPRNLCARIPDGVDAEEASFVALGAIALQGVRQADPRLGESVAVIGLGLLGQIAVQLLKANGCRVLASDPDPARLDLARRLGADAAVPPSELEEAAEAFSGAYGVDAVVIAAGTKEGGPVRAAGEIARKKGRVVIVGAVGMVFPREPYYRKELEVRMSTSYGPGRYDAEFEEKGRDYPYGYVRWTETRNMEAFLAMVRGGQVRVKELITHRFPIGEADRAYRLILEGEEPHLGVVIAYPDPPAKKPERVILLNSRPKAGAIRIGIVGAGSHVRDRLLPLLRAEEGVEIRSICTTGGVGARSLAEKNGAAYCTTDPREVLRDPEVDAVVIGTRHETHAALTLEALSAGKHLFVEKPLCLTEEELEAVGGVYEEKAKDGVHLMVGFNRRFSPHAAKARAFLEDRKDPLVMTFRVNAGAVPGEHWIQDPEIGGGRILGEVCHFVDTLQFLCGALPVSVHARSIARHATGITDDQSILSFGFACGSVGTVIYAAGGDTAVAKERLELFGDGRSVILDDFMTTEFYRSGRRTVFKSGKRDKGFDEEIRRFIRGVREGGAPAIPFGEIEAVTRACILAARSLRTGRTYSV